MRRFWPDLLALLALLFGLWRAGPAWPVAMVALAAWAGLLLLRVFWPEARQPFTAWMQVLPPAFFLTLRFLRPALHVRGAGSVAVTAGVYLGTLGVLVVLVRQMPWEGRATTGGRRARRGLGRWLLACAVLTIAGGALLPGRWPLLTLLVAGVILAWSAARFVAAASRLQPSRQRPL